MTGSGQRLTSWKEIASYFGRDVRTVMRWEKERALPVHRAAGGKSGVVFADIGELDAWARGVAPGPEVLALEPPAAPVAVLPATRTAARRGWIGIAAAGVIVLVGAGVWRLRAGEPVVPVQDVVLTADAIVGRNADGSTRWRYGFPGETVSPPFARSNSAIERLGRDGLLAGISDVTRSNDRTVRGGQLLWLKPSGQLARAFSFDDRLTIGSRGYVPPWVLSDYQVRDAGTVGAIAVAAHHYEWWPSIVTILDGRFIRRGSFVNAGWVEHLLWLPTGRIAIAGFSNARDGGMVALLDAAALDGQSPPTDDPAFTCANCGPGRPVRYVVMPRSEINRVSGAPFNRASVSARQDALIVRTVERPGAGANAPADALYEFTPALELVRATYTDRYWEAHAELERLGKITHTRAACPDRGGPPLIYSWSPAPGWTTVATRLR